MDRTTHLIITVVLATFLVAFGTAGYMVIEGWSMVDALYMTLITYSTVGYGEVHNVSPTGRIFTLFLIVLGIVGIYFAIRFAREYHVSLRDVMDTVDYRVDDFDR